MSSRAEADTGAIREDRWLSERIGHPVFTVKCGDPAAIEAELAEHRATRGVVMYQAKVAPDDHDSLDRLLAAGFSLVSTTVTLARAPGPASEPPAGVRDAVDGDAPALRRIAAGSLRTNRFHADPAIPDDVAGRIRADWAEACVTGDRAAAVLVAEDDGRVLGFLAVIEREDSGRRIRAIDLVAVDSNAQGRGIGGRLGEAFVASGPVADELRTGTQLSNPAAIRFYERLGFEHSHAMHDLHLHTAER